MKGVEGRHGRPQDDRIRHEDLPRAPRPPPGLITRLRSSAQSSVSRRPILSVNIIYNNNNNNNNI